MDHGTIFGRACIVAVMWTISVYAGRGAWVVLVQYGDLAWGWIPLLVALATFVWGLLLLRRAWLTLLD